MDAPERPKSDHDVGDAVLRVVAATLAAHCGRPDLVDRQGGEEFVAVFDDADADNALIAAERLRTAVEMPVHRAGAESLSVTVLIGAATISATDSSYEAVLQRANRALYPAKAAGLNCTRYAAFSSPHSPSLN